MRFPLFFGILFVAVLLLSLGTIAASYYFLVSQASALVPGQYLGVFRMLLVEQAAISAVFGFLISLLGFWFIGNVIARPIRNIATALRAFIESGVQPTLPAYAGAPKEIRELAADITQFSARVAESHRRDVEMARVKSDFISTAAHQLRTPLTGIRWALEALEKDELTESQKALVVSAREKSRDLVNIVKTLLDISSIESGKYKYTFQKTDMAVLISEVAQDFAPLAAKGNVALYYAKEAGSLPPVTIDRERMKWVLNNLIENAIRYTPAGGSVRILAEPLGDRLLLKVRDTGIGINPEDRGNIFERFYRAPNAVAKENEGNGLGLYIARTIAKDHGGDLDFAPNDDGAGTTFTVSLPVGVVPPQRGVV